jgi:ATP-dependent RNA helicase DDX51/DBP6
MKIKSLFPVQSEIIPIILNKNGNQSFYPNDVCVMAATGSGKTLAYVLPILEALKNRLQPCCRAIVLLPVSDLAEQVYNVFQSQLNEDHSSIIPSSTEINIKNNKFETNNNLNCILLSNKHPFDKEQSQLVNEQGQCLQDIIISTPGRLVDHIQRTKGFDIKRLQFLILDECDRIMDQIKQNWLQILNQAIFGYNNSINNDEQLKRITINSDTLNVYNIFEKNNGLFPFQKLLFSATITRNPEKLEQMQLFQPLFINVISEKLLNLKQESQIVIDEKDKEEQLKTPKPNEKTITLTKTTTKTEYNSNDQQSMSIPIELEEVFIQVNHSNQTQLR